jgi:hypothetical protein
MTIEEFKTYKHENNVDTSGFDDEYNKIDNIDIIE